ncbi:MAG: GNAT family N-acetyltransferase [Proteobacteria bacterium]|nr:GNAT family N-acetyltransferase [Pseudomonadota bacterium]
MQSTIRVAGRPGDARAIARVHVDSWHATYGHGLLPRQYLDRLTVPDLTTRWRRRLARPHHQTGVWVAEIAHEVIGFAECGPCVQDRSLLAFAGEVYMLYVHPDCLGRGIGSALLDRSMADLASRPFYWIAVWVVEGNRRARAFYRAHGLRPDGAHRTDHFTGQRVPVVRYVGPLNPIIDFDRLLEPSA